MYLLTNEAPQSKNTECAFQITYKLLGNFLKKLADGQCSLIAKYCKHVTIQPFTIGVN